MSKSFALRPGLVTHACILILLKYFMNISLIECCSCFGNSCFWGPFDSNSSITVCITVCKTMCITVCIIVCITVCITMRITVCITVCIIAGVTVGLTESINVCKTVCIKVRITVCIKVCITVCITVSAEYVGITLFIQVFNSKATIRSREMHKV